MVNLDEAKIVKLKSHGHSFEILADVEQALLLKQGEKVRIEDVLAISKVFKDAKKGEEASPVSIKEAFGTEDAIEAAKKIIQKGDIPVTAEHKARAREQKLRQIVNMIHKNAVDPKTHVPHPAERIKNALEEAKFRVDDSKDVKEQLQDALKSIRAIIPIKFEMKEIAIKIPAEFAAKTYPLFQKFGKKLREDWQTDGSFVCVVEIPGGLEEDMHNELNAMCHGSVESKILKTR